MADMFVLRESGRDLSLVNPEGRVILAPRRDGDRREIVFSLQIVASLDGQEAVFWLKEVGPILQDRLALQQRSIETRAGGFYCYEHAMLENLACLAYRQEQSMWRFVAVVDLGQAEVADQRIEIDLKVSVVSQIDWKVA